jgi:hypothetical protein
VKLEKPPAAFMPHRPAKSQPTVNPRPEPRCLVFERGLSSDVTFYRGCAIPDGKNIAVSHPGEAAKKFGSAREQFSFELAGD